jgi:hypothetical protein
VNDAVEALQAKVGVDSSAVTSSLDYKVAQLEAISHGKILQIVRATDSTDRTTTSQTFTDAGISVTITPQKSDSAIIIIWSFNVRPPNNYFVWTVITDSSNNSLVGNRGLNGSTNTTAGAWLVTQIAYDTPATTSAATYKGRWARENSGTATIFNSTWATGQMFAIEVSA